MFAQMMASGGGGSQTKLYTAPSTITIAAQATYTLTIPDMVNFQFLIASTTWQNTYISMYSNETGDMVVSNNAWTPSQSTGYLYVTINGNQINIRNGSTSRSAQIQQLFVQYT